MVKQTLKVITKYISFLTLVPLLLLGVNPVFAQESDTTFQVNVKESLSVSIMRPSSAATGGMGEFLRNDFAVSVTSNNPEGFTASIYANLSDNNVSLVNTSLSTATLPTLANSSTRSAFPANYWGYSLGEYTLDGSVQSSYTLNGHSYGETSLGNNNSNYYPMTNSTSTPIVIMDGVTTPKKTGSQNLYFGAKGGTDTAAGTYAGTVVVSVVTGGITNDNPITPTNPDTPSDDTPNDNTATYTGSTGTGATKGVGSTTGAVGTTVYTTTSASGNTTTTEVSGGDNRSAYASPQGEHYDTFSSIADSSAPIIGLVMASSTAGVTGLTFFILAYRDDDDDEDEEEEKADS